MARGRFSWRSLSWVMLSVAASRAPCDKRIAHQTGLHTSTYFSSRSCVPLTRAWAPCLRVTSVLPALLSDLRTHSVHGVAMGTSEETTVFVGGGGKNNTFFQSLKKTTRASRASAHTAPLLIVVAGFPLRVRGFGFIGKRVRFL